MSLRWLCEPQAVCPSPQTDSGPEPCAGSERCAHAALSLPCQSGSPASPPSHFRSQREALSVTPTAVSGRLRPWVRGPLSLHLPPTFSSVPALPCYLTPTPRSLTPALHPRVQLCPLLSSTQFHGGLQPEVMLM